MTNQEMFEDLKQFIDAKLSVHEKRFDAIDQRFDAMDERFDAMDDRFDVMDDRFDAIDERFNNNDMVQNEILNAVGEIVEDLEVRVTALETANV